MVSGKAALRAAEWARVDGVRGCAGGRAVARVPGASLVAALGVALAWPGVAQAKSPTPAPAASQPEASAACRASFERDNVVKPEAGPYRKRQITHAVNPVDGSAFQAETLIEVLPRQAVRSRVNLGEGETLEVRILDANTGWLNMRGRWEEAPRFIREGVLPETTHYLNAANASALQCLPPSEQHGQPVRSYRFRMLADANVLNPSPQPRQITVHFHAETGLPVSSRNDGIAPSGAAASDARIAADAKAFSELRYEFDRSIRIDKPDGV